MSRLKKPVQVLDLLLGDTSNSTLQLRYVGKRETTASGGTAAIDNNGDDNTKLLITLVGWDASTDAASTLLISASTTAGATTAATLQAVIDTINGADIGFEARRNHEMSDFSTDSDNFIDLAATQFGPDFTNFLFKDASEYATGWTGRCGVPNIAGESRIEILKLVGTGTYAAGSLAWKVSTDRGSSAADEVELFNVAGGATTVEATIFDYSTMESPPVVSGPLAIEAVATATSAVSAKLLYRPLN
jgi:hypothetical protein